MPKSKGFTLVELMVVISIIAILAVVGITIFSGVQKSARDAKRKADIDAMSLALENKYNSTGGYIDLADTDFSSGKIPVDPNSSKGNYFRVVASDKSGFKVCASLDSNPNNQCNANAANCFCKPSSQSTISNTQSSNLTGESNSLLSGYGYSGSAPSCDPNGTLMSGLVGYWKMDEGTGTSASDSSGNGNNGVWSGSGTHYVTGKIGAYAGQFNGTDDSVDLGNPNALMPSYVSISAWFKTTGTGAELVRKRLYGYSLELIPGDQTTPVGGVTFWIYNSTGVQYAALPSQTYNNGQWHQAVGVYDGSAVTLYIDGAHIATQNAGTIYYGLGSISLGKDGDYNGGFFNGSLDDVRIYNRTLSQTEVSNLYNGGSGCIP